MFLFLLGLTTIRSTTQGPIERFALGILNGIAIAVLGGVFVAVIKYYKRSPIPDANAALASAKVYDKAIWVGALVVAAIFAGKAVLSETYGGFIDAVIIGGLGLGVKSGFVAARWLMAGYAFVSPFFIIALGGGNAVVWPFVFYAICRSIMAHQRVVYPVTVNSGADSSSTRHVQRATQVPDDPGSQATQPSSRMGGPINMKNPTDKIAAHQSTASHLNQISESFARAPASLNIDEDVIYNRIGEELEGGRPDRATWMKAFAEANGDEKQVKAAYIRFRFEKLLTQERNLVEARNAEIERLAEQAKAGTAKAIIQDHLPTLVPQVRGPEMPTVSVPFDSQAGASSELTELISLYVSERRKARGDKIDKQMAVRLCRKIIDAVDGTLTRRNRLGGFEGAEVMEVSVGALCETFLTDEQLCKWADSVLIPNLSAANDKKPIKEHL